MASRWLIALRIALVLAAGQGACARQGASPGGTAAPSEPQRAPVTADRSGAGPEAAAAAASLPEGVVLASEPASDGVVLVIQNRSDQLVELALEASVERVAAGGAAAANAEALRLDCADGAPRCLSLVPGAELRPAAWPALQARAQCGSTARAAAATGSYRFSVRACGAAAATPARSSAPFSVP